LFLTISNASENEYADAGLIGFSFFYL